jgi:hypothetical protein
VSGFDPVALEMIEAEAVADAFGAGALRVAGAVCALRADLDEVGIHRPADSPPAVRTELRVERIGPERAAQFTAVLGAGFELAPAVTAMLEHLPGLPGWGWYLAYDGDVAVACGAVCVRGDHAWLGQAATLPEHRRRGGQSAITAARIAAPHAAGATVVVTETGEVVDDRPGSSYRNILRAGFEPAYVRPNYVPGTRACVGTSA